MIVACTWPEEVLRVPRKCADAALLKAAYRRVSIAVHPDKCSAGERESAAWHTLISCKLAPACFSGHACSRTLLHSHLEHRSRSAQDICQVFPHSTSPFPFRFQREPRMPCPLSPTAMPPCLRRQTMAGPPRQCRHSCAQLTPAAPCMPVAARPTWLALLPV